MKRCPQCEFIYEDDQSLCDMDGVLLVFDSRTLPNVHALATVSAPMPEKARRSRMVPAFATLILMLVIASVYYVTTLRSSAADNMSPASVTSVSTEPAVEQPVEQQPPVETPAAIPEPTPDSTEPAPETEKGEPTTAPKPAAVPAKKATAQPAAVRSDPKKDDSKVGSILKKTGKILKKPFKF